MRQGLNLPAHGPIGNAPAGPMHSFPVPGAVPAALLTPHPHLLCVARNFLVRKCPRVPTYRDPRSNPISAEILS